MLAFDDAWSRTDSESRPGIREPSVQHQAEVRIERVAVAKLEGPFGRDADSGRPEGEVIEVRSARGGCLAKAADDLAGRRACAYRRERRERRTLGEACGPAQAVDLRSGFHRPHEAQKARRVEQCCV